MPQTNDLRLIQTQCSDLIPVVALHENPWFSVKKREQYYTVEPSSLQVIILSTLEDSAVIMVRQLRPVINDITLELPAGAVNEGEKPIMAARRELMEETGIEISDISRFRALPPISASPNRNPFLLHIFGIDVTRKEFEKKQKHDDEILSVEVYPYRETISKIVKGDIYISVPMAVIGRYLFDKGSKAYG